MSAKQGIQKWHRCVSINVVAKSTVHMHITTELNTYWLSC